MAALFCMPSQINDFSAERIGKASCNPFSYMLQYVYPTSGRPKMVAFTMQYEYYYYFFLIKE
jgi:hypothetical protein